MIRLFRVYLRPYVAPLAATLVLLLIGALGNLYLPELNARIIDEGVVRGDIDLIVRIGGLMLLVSAALGVTAISAVYLAARVAMGFGRDVRRAVFSAVETFGIRAWQAPFMQRTYGWTPAEVGYWGGTALLVSWPLGIALGTCAHVTALRRTRVGPFGEADMVTLEALTALAADAQAAIDHVLRPPADALIGMPTLSVDRNAAGRLRRGQAALLRPGDPVAEGEICALDGGDVVALCSAQAGELKPVRVFRTPRRRITVPVHREVSPPAV